MASAEDPINNATPPRIFDEDLLGDDDDVDESEDDDSASSPGPGLGPAQSDHHHHRPRPAPSTQVTIAFPGVADLHNPQETTLSSKKPPPADESRKLFQRLWTDEDEIELLQGFLDYTTQRGGGNGSHGHHHDTTAFYDQIRSKFQLDFNKNQLVEKLRRLKKKYRNVMNRFGSGKDYAFKSPHDQATFEISAKIWGAPSSVNGNDDDDNPDCQSPSLLNLNGPTDLNSKNPSRPRKRIRVGAAAVKVEDKHLNIAFSNTNNTNNINSNQTSKPMAGSGGGVGAMSAVIEETVKSCLSPIFKELLGNSTNLTNASNSSNGGGLYGLGMALSPILPLGFAGAIGADRMSDDRWRKQQILELEVFSKRLELVQDQINAQLQELRSMGN